MPTTLRCTVCGTVFTIPMNIRGIGTADNRVNFSMKCPNGHRFDAMPDGGTASTGPDGWLHIAPAVRAALSGRDAEELKRLRAAAQRAQDDRNLALAAEVIAGLDVEGVPDPAWLKNQENRKEVYEILRVIIMALTLAVAAVTLKVTLDSKRAMTTPDIAPASTPPRSPVPEPPTTADRTPGAASTSPEQSTSDRTRPPLPSASSPFSQTRFRQVLPPNHGAGKGKRSR